ncbi:MULTISPECIES: DUF6717 family protein [Lysobacter]|jgi:hypothetical protein|uniref:Uncharacterized protein n=1 Tax=Lysobacter gummosus TaxID=262324 RepID=A0ABY3X9E7_9GAMM|nr:MULTISPECIES: DUF6717 family protein [Lysobacter]ALN92147.1 hypothetical protein LG3211_3190 [Lysobacter gummosus]UJB20903.1 hypothetical protein L1A79_07520 [Lysobacter capsici]UJQ29983.1 hypothetical protein L2D09_07340 [Lysobacter gummosus]UNP27772.1 hypothetical protein MOV92_14760 [Lysobacter gummosus]
MNAIVAIHPYKTHGMWVFDDLAVGLREEPFVSGADTIIDHMVAGIDGAQNGFTLLFSTHPFPGYQLQLDWQRADLSGNWYRSESIGMEGWLCPALLKYFDAPPTTLYAQFRAKAA